METYSLVYLHGANEWSSTTRAKVKAVAKVPIWRTTSPNWERVHGCLDPAEVARRCSEIANNRTIMMSDRERRTDVSVFESGQLLRRIAFDQIDGSWTTEGSPQPWEETLITEEVSEDDDPLTKEALGTKRFVTGSRWPAGICAAEVTAALELPPVIEPFAASRAGVALFVVVAIAAPLIEVCLLTRSWSSALVVAITVAIVFYGALRIGPINPGRPKFERS